MDTELDGYWRSMLFVPGNRPERFAKAFAAGADAVCIDLEDAVPQGEKAQAREGLTGALPPLLEQFPQVAAAVRINALGTEQHGGDVAALDGLPPKALCMLPKAHLADVQALAGATPRPVLALLEDARGIEEAYQVAAQPAVAGLMLGAGDLVAQLGARMEWEPLLYARSRLVMAAADGGCMALDVPCLQVGDADLVQRETERVARLGFDGKAAIHPAQVAPIHRALAPTEEEVARARGMVEAFAAAGGAAVAYEGVMLDEPVLVSARRVLARAARAEQAE